MYLKKIVPLGKQKDVSLCDCDLISIFSKITVTGRRPKAWKHCKILNASNSEMKFLCGLK